MGGDGGADTSSVRSEERGTCLMTSGHHLENMPHGDSSFGE